LKRSVLLLLRWLLEQVLVLVDKRVADAKVVSEVLEDVLLARSDATRTPA